MEQKQCAETRLPIIWQTQCVHSLIAHASCQACLESCHVGALTLADSQLTLDSQACDGCGVCAAVCPESAIGHDFHPHSVPWKDEYIALLACTKVQALTNLSTGVVSCIHALSLEDLYKLYAQGHRKLFVVADLCAQCENPPRARLDKHLQAINTLLELRGEPLFERIDISTARWKTIIVSGQRDKQEKKLRRRKFLGRVVGEWGQFNLRPLEPLIPHAQRQASTAIGSLLSDNLPDQRLPYVPVIDTQRCSACHTCISLCPHQALSREAKGAPAAYLIDAQQCTACHICTDVCEENAIQIEQNTIAQQTQIPLKKHQCDACGFGFYVPDDRAPGLCSICRKKTGFSSFQTL